MPSEPVVLLRAVIAPTLAGADLAFGTGCHVVLGSPEDGGAELVSLLAGVTAPRSGSVRVGGREPHRSPAVRRRIGSLLRDESLPDARSVGAALAWVLAGHAEPRELLSAAGLPGYEERPLRSLRPPERRALALVVAFARQDPLLLALYEPLATPLARSWVLDRLEQAAERCCVVVVTASARDAALIAPAAWLLEHGRFTRRPASPLAFELTPGDDPELVVHTPDARQLATRLARDPDVRSVHWDESVAPEQVVVRGVELTPLALAIARAARDEQLRILALAPVVPAIEAVHAATSALARAAYDNAYRAATTAYEAPTR